MILELLGPALVVAGVAAICWIVGRWTRSKERRELDAKLRETAEQATRIGL